MLTTALELLILINDGLNLLWVWLSLSIVYGVFLLNTL